MNTMSERKATEAGSRDSVVFRIVSVEHVGRHVYRVTTESKRYGVVTQDVFIFPESVLSPERPEELPSAPCLAK
jgi:hypothetical protein